MVLGKKRERGNKKRIYSEENIMRGTKTIRGDPKAKKRQSQGTKTIRGGSRARNNRARGTTKLSEETKRARGKT